MSRSLIKTKGEADPRSCVSCNGPKCDCGSRNTEVMQNIAGKQKDRYGGYEDVDVDIVYCHNCGAVFNW